ncbi:hypothetical protein [Tenuifilum thalassicum]|uniref:MORN repeat variant n=1 Tax=Tenuifilum thalassicum TaxID=2590900 RepID=A0A7D4BJ16_9BACT|nr:hypothetical protein [Tenuifilum thalassicum]QKG79159.1 hypothetical protein FHG85_02400 [Tenuifilum thalassicum]
MRLTRLIFLSTFLYITTTQALAQPILDIYFSNRASESRGPNFSKVEEIHELYVPRSGTVSYFKVVKIYNSNGRVISEKKYNKVGGIMGEAYWEYNSKGEPTKFVNKQFMNFKGWVSEKTILTYSDSTGLLSKIDIYYGNKLQKSAEVTSKDMKLTKVLVFNDKNVHVETERVVYLPQNNSIRVLRYKANDQFISATTYPLNPKLPEPPSSIKREFNSYGDIILEAIPHNKFEKGYYYEYDYDSYHNWIEKRIYICDIKRNGKIKNKKLEYKITRKIQY